MPEIESESIPLILDHSVIAELYELDDDGDGALVEELVKLFLAKVPHLIDV